MAKIEHSGVVDSVLGKKVTVKIISESACASCHAKSACTMADREDKWVEVESHESFQIGDAVQIIGESSQGLKATWWAYILPLFLLLGSLIITFILSDGNELLSGLLALLVLIPYYLILYFSKQYFKESFTFSIKSKKDYPL